VGATATGDWVRFGSNGGVAGVTFEATLFRHAAFAGGGRVLF